MQVEAASDRVEQALTAAFDAVSLPNLGKMPVKLRPAIVHDRFNNAVWIKIPKGSPVRLDAWMFMVICLVTPDLSISRTHYRRK